MARDPFFTPLVEYNTYRYLGLTDLKKKLKDVETENIALQAKISQQQEEIEDLKLRVEDLENSA